MVFTSIVNFVRSRGPDEFWRKRKIFKLSAVSAEIYDFENKFTKPNIIFSISLEEDEIVIQLQSEMSTEH